MSWADEAACRDVDLAVFYPQPGYGAYRRAAALCAACPVRRNCLAEALRTESVGHRFGMWGGLMPEQRAALALRGRPLAAS